MMRKIRKEASIERKKSNKNGSYIIICHNCSKHANWNIIYTNINSKARQSEYGLYSLVTSVISYLTILDFGFGNAIIIYTTKYRVSKQK